MQDDTIVIRQPGCAPVEGGSAEILQRYLERRAELALDCSLAAPLIVDLEGEPLSAERLQAHYETARTSARCNGGQWFILPCPTEPASPRCRWTIRARKHRRERCTIMTGTISL